MENTRQMIQSGIESDDAIGMTQLMLRSQFSQEHALKAQQMLMFALQSGLPAEPLMNKAYEGIAKKVQSRSILQAMEKVRSRYAFAYKQAGQLTEEPDQVSELGNLMADSLSAGIERGDLELIRTRLQERTTQMERKRADELTEEAYKTVRDMARLGASSGAITDVVSQALRQNHTAREMKTMRTSFMNNARYGSPDSAAKSYGEMIGKGESAQGPGSPDAEGAGMPGNAGDADTGKGGAGGSDSGSGGSESGGGEGHGGPGEGRN
jgi:uncharacterized protein YoaH (UPF0181 family)